MQDATFVRTVAKPSAFAELAPTVELAFSRLKALENVPDSWTFDLSSVDCVSQQELVSRDGLAAVTMRKLQALNVQIQEPTRSLAVMRLLAEVLHVLELFAPADNDLGESATPSFHTAMASIWDLCGEDDVVLA